VKLVSGLPTEPDCYTVSRHKLVVFVGSGWREQPKPVTLSPSGRGQG